MKTWRGTSLTAIAALHVAFTLFLGLSDATGTSAPLASARPGVGSAQPPDVLLLMLLWSIFFGVALAILGLVIRGVEAKGGRIPVLAGGLLVLLCVFGCALMPVSASGSRWCPRWP
jgi:hypothetical protein